MTPLWAQPVTWEGRTMRSTGEVLGESHQARTEGVPVGSVQDVTAPSGELPGKRVDPKGKAVGDCPGQAWNVGPPGVKTWFSAGCSQGFLKNQFQSQPLGAWGAGGYGQHPLTGRPASVSLILPPPGC